MESMVDLKFYRELLQKRKDLLKIKREAQNKLQSLNDKTANIDDTLQLLQDDFYLCTEDDPVDFLECHAIQSEINLLLSDLNETDTAIKALLASLEKIEEDAMKLKRMSLNMKRILQTQERRKVIPFRVPNEGERSQGENRN